MRRPVPLLGLMGVTIKPLQAAMAIAAMLGPLLAGPAAGQELGEPAQPPRLGNPEVVAAALDSAYPARFGRAGIGGVARFRVHVDEDGLVDALELTSSTGLPWLDRAAAKALAEAEFTPAGTPHRPRATWVRIPLQIGGREQVLERELSVLGRGEARRHGQAHYPGNLRGSNRGVRVAIGFFVDGTGRVVDREVIETGCATAAVATALEMADRLQFENRTGQPEDRFFSIGTFTFLSDSVDIRMRGDSLTSSCAPCLLGSGATVDEDGATKERPRLRNPGQVSRALEQAYPRSLLWQGIGGTTRVMLRISESGTVQERMVWESSGLCDLDEAALTVVDRMRFHPAQRNGHPESAWAVLDVAFETR